MKNYLYYLLPITYYLTWAIGSTAAIAQSPTNNNNLKTEKISKIRFVPPPVPNGSSPQGRSRGGASRSDTCKVADRPLTALVPTNDNFVWGLTVSERPTFFFYVPYYLTADSPIEFVLQDEQKNTLYQTYLNVSQTRPGIVKVTMPDTIAPLEINKMYRWYFLIYCNLDDPVFVEGWVQRIVANPDLKVRLENSTLQQQSRLLANNGIWYDALSTLANLRSSKPKDRSLSRDWQSLLESAGLGSIALETSID
jgi:hypothetical protein